MRVKWVVALLLLVGGLCSLADITVAPLALKLGVHPGEAGTASVSVRNVGQTVADVRITLHDWWRTPEGKLEVLPPGKLAGSCAPWITYSPTSILLKPGDAATITVHMEVPADAVGDHWALLLVAEYPPPEERPPSEATTGTTRIVVAYAVKLLWIDPVNAAPAGEIREVKVLETSPLKLAIRYANTGNCHTMNTGTVSVKDIFGETVREFPLQAFPTLPGEERVVTVEDPSGEPLPQGFYYVFVTVDFGGDYLVQGGVPLRIPSP